MLTENSSQALDWQRPAYQLIEEQAIIHAQNVAVSFGDSLLTYQELNQRANQLANLLIARGLNTGDCVGSFFEPSLEVVVGLLAIQKAGGVYVPIDPNHPAERVKQILNEVEPRFVLTHDHAIGRLPASHADVFNWSQDSEALHTQSSLNPAARVDANSDAYIIFTSGTTGKPKGVVATHSNLSFYLQVARDTYGFSSADKMPAMARFTFSISLFELLTPLISGAQLILIARANVLDFAYMHNLLTRITFIHTSPSLMRNLLNFIDKQPIDEEQFQRLRHASCGGDFVAYDLLERMKARFSRADVCVIYGCSEIACMGFTYFVPREHTMTSNRVGFPMQQVAFRLLDEAQNQVERGQKGEVWVSSPGVNRGYLNMPELTAERFVEMDGQRYYRTGDIGRLHDDDSLELLGRSDFQIKFLGVRIEPVEIENVLRQVGGVRDALVALKSWGQPSYTQDIELENKTLVAYLLPQSNQTISLAEIRHVLQRNLPDSMHPRLFQLLETFPVNINGKIDRAGLPDPTESKFLSEHTVTASNSATEIRLIKIWREILRQETVQSNSDFFTLGGDSLMTVQLCIDIDHEFGVALTIEDCFLNPILSELARVIDERKSPTIAAVLPERPGVVLLHAGDAKNTKPPIFCVFGVILYRNLSQHLNSSRPIYAAYLEEEVNWLASKDLDARFDLAYLARNYIELLKSIQPTGPYCILGESFGGLIAYEMAQQLIAQGEVVETLFMLDCYAPHSTYRAARSLGERIQLHLNFFQEKGLSYLNQKLKRKQKLYWEQISSSLLPTWRRLFSQVPRSMLQAAGTHNQRINCVRISDAYEPVPYGGATVLFRALDRNPFEDDVTQDMGWGKYIAHVNLEEVPGDHLSILLHPNVEVLAEKMNKFI